MSENETENDETTEPTEPEAVVEEVPVEEETAVEEAVAEAPAEEAHAAEEEPVAEAEPAPAAEPEPEAPAQPAKKQKALKHVPRRLRRTRSKPKREPLAERKAIVRLEKPEREKGRRQERRGVVVSDAMDKTIVVKVESVRAHQRYKKVIRRSVKFHAHDETNQAHIGDRVRIVETRPLSKTKRWRLAEILEVAK
jgi:small subunit ribosomal protein S17